MNNFITFEDIIFANSTFIKLSNPRLLNHLICTLQMLANFTARLSTHPVSHSVLLCNDRVCTPPRMQLAVCAGLQRYPLQGCFLPLSFAANRTLRVILLSAHESNRAVSRVFCSKGTNKTRHAATENVPVCISLIPHGPQKSTNLIERQWEFSINNEFCLATLCLLTALCEN